MLLGSIRSGKVARKAVVGMCAVENSQQIVAKSAILLPNHRKITGKSKTFLSDMLLHLLVHLYGKFMERYA